MGWQGHGMSAALRLQSQAWLLARMQVMAAGRTAPQLVFWPLLLRICCNGRPRQRAAQLRRHWLLRSAFCSHLSAAAQVADPGSVLFNFQRQGLVMVDAAEGGAGVGRQTCLGCCAMRSAMRCAMRQMQASPPPAPLTCLLTALPCPHDV